MYQFKELQASEFNECLVLVEWLELNNIKYAHIHQETYTPSWKQKQTAKRMGVKAGIPDYMIIHGGKLIFIEMKRVGGKLSQFQKDWLEQLNKINNIRAIVCYGADEAINYLKSI